MPPKLTLAVCGLHLKGQPLNWQLTELGSVFVKACKSAPIYELYAFTDAKGVTKPAMISPLSKDTCAAIDLELWDVPAEAMGRFIDQVPPPLGIGTIQLEDGNLVKGFIGEAWIAEEAKKEKSKIAKDITRYGGWLAYLESTS